MNEDKLEQAAWDLGMMSMQASVNASTSNRDRKWQEEQAEKERAWQEEMYREQWTNQMQFIDKMNEYNSPAEQMKRLQEAGINPMYAVSGNIQNVSSGNPSANVPSGRSFAYKSKEPDLIAAVGVSNAYKQGQVLSQQADYLAAQAKKERDIAYGIRLDNEKKEAEKPYWARTAETAYNLANANLSRVNAEVQQRRNQVAKLVEDLEQTKWYNQYLRSLEPNLRAQVEANTRKLKASANIEEYRDGMKEVNQWVGVGTDVVGMILQGLNLYRGGIPTGGIGSDYGGYPSRVDMPDWSYSQ